MKSETKKPKRIRKPKSVNTAMWLYFSLFAFLLIFFVDAVFTIAITNKLVDQSYERAERSAGLIAAAAKSPDCNNLDIEIFRTRDSGVSAYVFDGSGALIAPQAFPPDNLDKVFEGFSELAEREEGTLMLYRTRGYINAAVKVTSPCFGECYILAVCPLKNSLDMVNTMLLYLILVGLALLLLALSVSYLFSRKITRGLKNISDNAVTLSRGDFNVQFNNADYKELAQLSDSLNNLRDEVKKSGDFQREILANVTHDLKTPITMIKAYASMIQEISGDDPEKRNKHLQVIIDESDRLTGLINDVLVVSKVNSNLEELNVKVFNLTEFVYGIIDKFGYLQETQGYNFMVDIQSNLYTRADEEKIGQVIYNLLGNAVNYTGADKTVYISLKQSLDGERVKFTVRDTGKGIAKEDIGSIWDRYFRSQKDHVRPVKGTGLGLSIVKRILTAHSFDYGVESEIGKGSVFWVDFPSVSATLNAEPDGKQT